MERILIAGAGLSGLYVKKYVGNSIIIDKNSKIEIKPNFIDFMLGDNVETSIERHVDMLLKIDSIDFSNRCVISGNKKIEYDKIVVSLGSSFNTSFIKGENFLYKINSERDLNKLIKASKKAEKITVIGAGYLGVELAGAFSDKNVTLIDAADTVLPHLNRKLIERAFMDLNELNIDVRLKTMIDEVNKEYLIANGEKIKSDVTVFAGGFSGNNIINDSIKNRNSRIIVNRYLRSIEYDDVYACGDSMFFDASVPMSGIIARQSGITVAKNLLGIKTEFKPNNFANIIRIKNDYFGMIGNAFVSGGVARFLKKASMAITKNIIR
ncbi:NAD(P)/FAD-dependent oxidoreductase [Picrophilus oshimae]|uniref:NADH:ubiquinone reductase (non-electrogenic) n=1 Tax=Picrophilus torridus (strain ATCC 700027 / DSM 9790 / JCM 10055 / NBRC 100828 / KAW 2/3) TaxID=1122961 RepID=A0A8G2FXP2_PICTO|nr:FAD-dependent oxidoreductase [Picrophilus oshimae]SMD31389.1 NADH dehydrogenase [Picrophilus oshimae DSM 9789]